MKETEELFNPLPPHSTEAEKGILACILIDPENCLSICAAEIDAEKFYGRNNQIIYQAMMDLSESRKQVDTITIYSRIKSHGLEHESGGIEYISTLPDYTPSARNLQFYIDIVTEKATLRGIIRVANDLLRRAYDHGNNAPTELLDIAERDILALATMRRDIEPTHIKKLLRGTLDQIESYMANPNSHPGIPTGFADFEQLTGGLQPSEMVVLA
ncbi:MAG: hypothetical protein OEV64_14385, partial [Desulfobulbaceae bacterium]|nr:hypothetical protein [Desulfobulbaceae bacterium]